MIRVGWVSGAFGIRGAVKVQSLTDFDDRFDAGGELVVDGAPRRIEWRQVSAGALVLKLSGLDDRNAAEALRGSYLEVPDTAARELEGPAWYLDQLLGLTVQTESGRELGRLDEVWERPANDVWIARLGGDAKRETLVPATREAVCSVDLAAGRVVVADWLLDSEEG
ncbi:MAG: ribosome maturation factor RimM [Candidatus Dormiibacterota bacterium]